MSNEVTLRHNRPHRDQFHPLIYRVAGGLVIWFILSAWILFDHHGYIELALAFISILLLMAVGIPWILWRQRRKYSRSGNDAGRDAVSLRDWGNGDMDVCGARLPRDRAHRRQPQRGTRTRRPAGVGAAALNRGHRLPPLSCPSAVMSLRCHCEERSDEAIPCLTSRGTLVRQEIASSLRSSQ